MFNNRWLDCYRCHNVTGECQCAPNVVGAKCSECADGFFNLTAGGHGCSACGCLESLGADGPHCDPATGQCRCKPGVSGLRCDQCTPGHYGFGGPDGCKRKLATVFFSF
jgi:hypothetical protein